MGLKAAKDQASVSASHDRTPKNSNAAADQKVPNQSTAKPPRSRRKDAGRPSQGGRLGQRKVSERLYQSDTNDAPPALRAPISGKEAHQAGKRKPDFIQMHYWQEWNSTHDEAEAQFNNDDILKRSPVQQDNTPQQALNKLAK